ncbi:hypothetical protein FGG08_005311 [Glutinoglossum americanum]|uniref:F-box domain-containing protein n=1 Tax=Glutinoglossum americanum TaxID=1670608 RepID=A0A9P8L2Z8_9PEZI|nr:hypothetical protein FGG08_005311 [Glutinoglossum americanum]
MNPAPIVRGLFPTNISQASRLLSYINQPYSVFIVPNYYFTLSKIPSDIFILILKYCNLAAFKALRLVNKYFLDLVDTNESCLVGSIIRSRYAEVADVFKASYGRYSGWHCERGIFDRKTFHSRSWEYLRILEDRAGHLRKFGGILANLGVRRSDALEMALMVTEINMMLNGQSFNTIPTPSNITALSSARNAQKLEAYLTDLAEKFVPEIHAVDFVRPHWTVPQELRIPPDVTAEELEYYGVPAIYGKHFLMKEEWGAIPDTLIGWWMFGYDYNVDEKWFENMRVWVDYHGPNDRWGTLHVRFLDPSRDVEKLFAILKELPEGQKMADAWWEGWEMEPSATFRRATFWETPDTIWTRSNYGLDQLFWDPEDPDNFWPCNVNDPSAQAYRWDFEPLDIPW